MKKILTIFLSMCVCASGFSDYLDFQGPIQVSPNEQGGGSVANLVNPSFSVVRINKKNECYAIWSSGDPNKESPVAGNIFTNNRTSKGVWGKTPAQINDPSGVTANNSLRPQLNNSGEGFFPFVWSANINPPSDDYIDIYASFTDETTPFTKEVKLSSADDSDPALSGTTWLAINSKNRTEVAWESKNLTNYVTTLDTSSNTWNLTSLSSYIKGDLLEYAIGLELAIAVSAVTVPVSGGSVMETYLYTRTRNTWDEGQKIATGEDGIENQSIDINDSGEAVVVWSENKNIFALTRSSSGAWSSKEQINATSGGSANISYDPQVTINSSGEALVAWDTFTNDSKSIDAKVYSTAYNDSKTWEPEILISNSSLISRLVKAQLNDSGLALICFSSGNSPSNQTSYTTFRTPTNTWQNSIPLPNQPKDGFDAADCSLNNNNQAVILGFDKKGNMYVYQTDPNTPANGTDFLLNSSHPQKGISGM